MAKRGIRYSRLVAVAGVSAAVLLFDFSSGRTVQPGLNQFESAEADTTAVADSTAAKTAAKSAVKLDTTIRTVTDLPYPLEPKSDRAYDNLEEHDGMRFNAPKNLQTEITYNPETKEYDVHEKTGAFESSAPYSLSQKEYNAYNSKKNRDDYWAQRAEANRRGDNSKFRPKLSIGGEAFEKVFGGNAIDIKPQGSAQITMGYKINSSKNPALTSNLQSQGVFDLQNKIQMNVTGNVGDKVKVTVKYDTESQFEFDNQMKLAYQGDEDEIIKKIEAGNVTFPVKNSLITGSQSLFGFRTDLQFGKLTVSNVFSRQRGEFTSINVQGGAQQKEFKIRCDEYEQNRHFFLSHYFREHYEGAFKRMPNVSMGIIITDVQVWMSQLGSTKTDDRNILAIADLGGTSGSGSLPNNKSDKVFAQILNLGIVNSSDITTKMAGYEGDKDYVQIDKAYKLPKDQYSFNPKLGYISLKSSVASNMVLGIAYKYQYQGKTYQVGQFAEDVKDGVLVVKLLKSKKNSPAYSYFDLMMKNVYNLNAYQISSKNFMLDIMYEDDKTGVPIPYLPAGKIKGKPLLSVMNLDTISSDGQPYPDGFFDYIEGVTVNSSTGQIYFPVLEPFGQHLDTVIGDKSISQKYVYNELYRLTQTQARQVAEKNKFLLKGKYSSSASNEISLNTTQVQQGSVTVTAGGRKLVENSDYTVDYQMGKVRIINQGLMQSGTPIKVSLESNPMFNMKTKTMLGSRFDYKASKKITLGATVLNLSEIPLSTKVNFEDFPINNTVWGLDGTYSTESQMLTNLVNKIPLISTKAKSKFTVSAEFAQLIPSHSSMINNAVEVDYFEAAETSTYLWEPTAWRLSATPQGQKKFFREATNINDWTYGMNRAHISWYNINSSYFYNTASVAISTEAQSEPYSHSILKKELFPNYNDPSLIITPMSMLNIAYYPSERGPYNFDVKGIKGVSSGIDPTTGKLNDPASRWGGITRAVPTTDFEEANIEYIEFWLMDPFLTSKGEAQVNPSGGDLYVDLGDVSEDLLHDSRRSAENGLSAVDSTMDLTKWALVPKSATSAKGFVPEVPRTVQDVGYDGMNNAKEQDNFGAYLSELKAYSPSLFDAANNDPAHDDFRSYITALKDETSIVSRYKYYTGTEGNSPDGNQQGTGKLTPDVEDINDDNTLQETESYYQYHVSLRPSDLVVGKNFIVDRITENKSNLPNGKKLTANWYQFKIPIKTTEKQVIGSISDFKSIQFMRMFLRGFSDSVVLRMAEFGLVRSTWRKYDSPIYDPGEYDLYTDAPFDIFSVNIEENSSRKPVNYVLPPGVDRVTDPFNAAMRQLNEGALAVKVKGLEDGNSKAVYKNYNKDFRMFGRLKMFIHAEQLVDDRTTKDGDLYAFIRLGSDYTKNYYEYAIPLKMTEEGVYQVNSDDDRRKVWPDVNALDMQLSVLTNLKEARNLQVKNDATGAFTTEKLYSIPDPNYPNNRVTILGNPSLGNVKVIMLGVRNRKRSASNNTDDGQTKSAIVWFNEMRLTDFNEQGGWGATISTRADLADFANVSLAGKTTQAGFGSIDQKVFQRSQDNLYQYDFASNVSLGKFFPEKIGVQLPFYVGYSESYIIPKYDPTNTDLLLSDVYASLSSEDRAAHQKRTLNYLGLFSYNFTNVRVAPQGAKPYPWAIQNFSTGYSYSKQYIHNIDYEYQYKFNYKANFNYDYNLKPKVYEPLTFVSPKPLALIHDFNFSLLPSRVAMRNEWAKQYQEIQRRNLSEYAALSDYKLSPVYAKQFSWDRYYEYSHNLTKGLRFDYSATNMARVQEPQGRIQMENKAFMSSYHDSLYNRLKTFGKTTQFSQKVDLTYKVPINKIPLLDWTSGNYKYGGTYNWDIGPEFRDPKIQPIHNVKNSNTNTADVNFTLTRLYEKSSYLKAVNQRVSSGKKEIKTETVQFQKSGYDFYADDPLVISHGLKTDDIKMTVTDKDGRVVDGKLQVLTDNTASFTTSKDYKGASVSVTGTREIKPSLWQQISDQVVSLLMMTQNAQATLSISNGTYVPGYKNNTANFGLYDPWNQRGLLAPGWDYVAGWNNESTADHFINRGWIINDSTVAENYRRTHSVDLRLKMALEPIKSLKVNLNSDYTFSKNQNRYLLDRAGAANQKIDGGFTISCNTMLSSIDPDKAYNTFRSNRITIANRLAAQSGMRYETDPKTGFPTLYTPTSQDVMIHSFYSAYTGQDPSNVYIKDYFYPTFTSVKDVLRSINWRATYTGLSKFEFIKQYFKSFNINHSYASTYSINNYQTYVSDIMVDNKYLIDQTTGGTSLVPSYSISSVSFNERYAPLVGLDTKLKNDITTKLELRHNMVRTLSFVNSEITEVGGWEWVFGAGYTIKDFVLNIKTDGGTKNFKNDIKIQSDFSVRDNETIRRNIIQNKTQTMQGQLVYSWKNYADYSLTQSVTLRAYIDYTLNKPKTNGYENSTLSFGINIRITMM